MSLFADMPEFADVLVPPAKRKSSSLSEHSPCQYRTSQQKAAPPRADRHLAAAGRLAKAIRRLPDHSVEQTRAGQAICRHLIALLEESAQDSPPIDA